MSEHINYGGGEPCNNPNQGNALDYSGFMKELEAAASRISDGHLSVLKFTTNWRVWFFTPDDRLDIQIMPSGKTFEEAATAALEKAKMFNGSCSAKAKWERIRRAEGY